MEKARFTLNLEQTTDADGKTWIHIIPAGRFSSIDGRGPFQLDGAAVLANSQGCRLPVDINHAIDYLAGSGAESPAYGWIVALEERTDGIWGNVEWTPRGQKLIDDKAYGFISPVFYPLWRQDGIGYVCQLESASLCNNPALPQLKGLFTKQGDRLMEKELMAALGLPEGATAAQAVEAAKALKAEKMGFEARSKELCALAGAADEKQLMGALTAKLAAAEAGKSNLEKTVAELNAKFTAQQNAVKKEKAEAFVSAALKAGKIVPVLKDHFIARHIADPDSVETEINAALSINAGGIDRPPEGGGSLDAAEKEMCAAMGIDEKAFLATKQEKK